MSSTLLKLTDNLRLNKSLEEKIFNDFIFKIDCNFPEDYILFMKQFNGGEGFIGEIEYLRLWKIDDLEKLNHDYEVNLYAPDFLIFGSNGGGTAYSFNKVTGNIYSFEFIG